MPKFRSPDGLDLFYIDVPATEHDRGEPILLIHGFASNHLVNWVSPQWVKTLTGDGRRVLALDNRGHGASAKPYRSTDYAVPAMAADARALLDHLGLSNVDVMGYSMGARISAVIALDHPALIRSLILGGLGYRLVDGAGLPVNIAEALEAPALDAVDEPTPRMFRRFAEATGGDLVALAACIRGARQTVPPEELARIMCPVLIVVGTQDTIAGDPRALAALIPNAEVLDVPDRDHNLAVGDKVYKAGVLRFLAER